MLESHEEIKKARGHKAKEDGSCGKRVLIHSRYEQELFWGTSPEGIERCV